jgi:hypothetical protein
MQSVLENLRLWNGNLDDLVSQWIGIIAIQLRIALGAPLWAMIGYSGHLLGRHEPSFMKRMSFLPTTPLPCRWPQLSLRL